MNGDSYRAYVHWQALITQIFRSIVKFEPPHVGCYNLNNRGHPETVSCARLPQSNLS
jgi:hypothetical protein